jgi:autophagy-related protein 9
LFPISSIRRRVPEIVAFLHEHTVHVDGLGDVCSLAQMDICRDGDARLASLNQSIVVLNGDEAQKQRGKAASSCGKAELSLLNFAAQNPDWQPPKAGAEFIRNVKELVGFGAIPHFGNISMERSPWR